MPAETTEPVPADVEYVDRGRAEAARKALEGVPHEPGAPK